MKKKEMREKEKKKIDEISKRKEKKEARERERLLRGTVPIYRKGEDQVL